ncbi:MAG: hypothetical protein R3B57_12855 [Phycisphaerales bacterium]
MRSRQMRALVALNACLLVVLALVTAAPRALAQAGVRRPPGTYAMVGGEPASGNANAVYVLDTANRELIVLRWNNSTNQLEGVGYRDLRADTIAEPSR